MNKSHPSNLQEIIKLQKQLFKKYGDKFLDLYSDCLLKQKMDIETATYHCNNQLTKVYEGAEV